jgi:hypothetical protein
MSDNPNLDNKQLKEATFHGGFVRPRGEGRGVRVSTPKVQELSSPNAAEAQERVTYLALANSFPNRNSPIKVRKTKLAVLGIPSDILDSGHPEYARTVRLANAYRKIRAKELYLAHGYVSSGVTALLSAGSLALAASRFMYETAANADPSVISDLLSKGAKLADSARQNEISAWELCARESVIYKRNQSNNQELPWLTDYGPNGNKPNKGGRPRKVDRNAGQQGGVPSPYPQGHSVPEVITTQGE